MTNTNDTTAISVTHNHGITTMTADFSDTMHDQPCQIADLHSRLGEYAEAVPEHEAHRGSLELPRQPSADNGQNRTSGIHLPEGFYTAKDIFDLRLSMEWVIEGILPAGGLMILSGDCGLGKSFFALDLAIRVAGGKSEQWLRHFNVAQGPVVYIDLENGMALIQRRFYRLGALPDDQLHICYRHAIDLAKEADADFLREQLAAIQPVLIIFDSLRRFHSSNENAADCMSGVMETISTLHPAAKLLLHHCRKQNGSPNSRMRGSTDLSAVVDSHLCLESTKDDVSRLVHAKSRWQKPQDPFHVRWVERGGLLCFEYDGADVIEDKSVGDDILGVLEDCGGAATRQQLLNIMHLSESTLDRWLNKLVATGVFEKERAGQNMLYRVSNNDADDDDGMAQMV